MRFKYFDLRLVVPNIVMTSSGGISNLDHNSKHEKVDENYVREHFHVTKLIVFHTYKRNSTAFCLVSSYGGKINFPLEFFLSL